MSCFPGRAVVKNPPASPGDTGDMGSISRLGRSPGAGNGNPFQYSCWGNPMDRGAWLESMGSKELDMTQQLNSYVTLGETLPLSGFNFLTGKKRMKILPKNLHQVLWDSHGHGHGLSLMKPANGNRAGMWHRTKTSRCCGQISPSLHPWVTHPAVPGPLPSSHAVRRHLLV